MHEARYSHYRQYFILSTFAAKGALTACEDKSPI